MSDCRETHIHVSANCSASGRQTWKAWFSAATKTFKADWALLLQGSFTHSQNGGNSGFSISPKDTSGDRTTGLPVSRWPALPPEQELPPVHAPPSVPHVILHVVLLLCDWRCSSAMCLIEKQKEVSAVLTAETSTGAAGASASFH